MKQEKKSNEKRIRPTAGKKWVLFFLAAAALVAVSCQKEIADPSASADAAPGKAASKMPKAPVVVVQAGSSIQAAVNSAEAGTVIKIEAGIYKESVVVNKPNMTLMGEDGVIIQNPGEEENGITVRDAGDGFTLKNVTVRDFEENGVILIRVDGFLLSHVSTIDNGEYGLFPVFSTNGVIEHCVATGHSDTGIYVGQSSHVAINHNEAYGNVNGIEIENCSFVTADKNHSYDNVVGILSVLLPGLQVKEASDIIITNNQVQDNNHVNFAEPGETESFVPSGSGILVVGTDNMLVKDNHVSGNNFTGIAVVSTLVLGALANLPPEAFADIEPNPDGVKVVSNLVKDNGAAPPAGLPFPGVDLLWDGSGNGNCWSRNIYNTSYPPVLPACQ
ncbi:MAG TPA: parallel beta-helix domain-containing protein [Flavisolibacter sp.]|nr:parallel beta-helix domain-containing protein [Flavisolibacter sp.]